MGLGYNATTSRQEALRTFLTDPSLIDVVVASITVPCARELQIVEMVCGIDPHMPIVLMSRPSHIPELVIRTRYLGKVRILPKPAPMESLQKSLSKALAARYP
jgi:DNA-binding NtrC family response regulator